MILNCPNGAVVVIADSHWTPGAFLSVNHYGGASTVLPPDVVDQVIDELTRIRDAIAARNPKPQEQAA